MSLDKAESFERDYMAASAFEDAPVVEPPPNMSNYLYASTIFIPLIVATLFVIAIPTDPDSKSGRFLKIFAVLFILVSVIAMYMYHKKVDFTVYLRPKAPVV